MPWNRTASIIPPEKIELVFIYPDNHREVKELDPWEIYVGDGTFKSDTMPTHWAYKTDPELPDPDDGIKGIDSENAMDQHDKLNPVRRGTEK